MEPSFTVKKKPSENKEFVFYGSRRRGILWMIVGLMACAGLLNRTERSSPRAGPANVPPPAATACTIYASASGTDGNSGTGPSAPKTFMGAAAKTQPGSVVCLLPGTYQLNSTFYPPASGTPSAWVVYQSYGDGDVNVVWTGGSISQPMLKFGDGKFPSGPAYLEFRGLKLDGRGDALDGFLCTGSHHLRFIGNVIMNTGGAGIQSIACDYLTSEGNKINHNGYLYGWTSGISYNSTQWFDFYPGLHNIIAGNVIAGEYDGSEYHTDGNGIILDLSNGSSGFSSANTPATLVINNVVYGNGGRCIEAATVTNFWVVNNTCYKNDLDPALKDAGSITTNNARDGYVINNIVVSSDASHPAYDQENSNTNIRYGANLCSGSSNNFSYSDTSQFISADPLFFDPPQLNPSLPTNYATVLAPSLLGDGLKLQPLSPGLRKGIDASMLPGLPAAIVADLRKYIYSDIGGNPRPRGTGNDLGAYQF